MVKKKKAFLFIVLCADIIYLTSAFFVHHRRCSYPRFTFNWGVTLALCACFLLANLILGLVLLLCRKGSPIVKGAIILPLVAVIGWGAVVWWMLLTPGSYWTSETDDFSEFTRVDEYLDNIFEIAGLRISDLIEFEINSVDDFQYLNRSSMMTETFVFKGGFDFERDSYEKIKNAFENSDEWIKEIYTPEEQLNIGMSGKYVFDYEVPVWESNTTNVKWETALVVFSDEQCRIEFDLSGCIET